MILKKPYAFLIKHFRIIHLLLIIPMIYLLNRTRAISTFLNTYMANNFVFNSDDVLSTLASNYINIFMYLAIIIILVVLVSYALILQRKDKPTKFYKVSIVYYAVLLVLLLLSFSMFTAIEEDTLNTVFARVIRDISWIVYISEWVFIILMVIRGTGFNIKTFNFKSEWTNLEITNEDNEEFEFLVGKESYKTKRNFRRFKREFKYYYLENKFVFSLIFIIIIILIGSLIYRQRETFFGSFSEGASIPFGYVNLTVLDSFVTDYDMNGKEIAKDKAYVVLQIKLNNRYREDKVFNYANLTLNADGNYSSPSLYLANYFLDFGVPFTGNVVKGNTEGEYILVYEIRARVKNEKLTLEFFNMNNKKINLSPTVFDKNILDNKINKGTKFKLKDTPLNETTISFLDFALQNRYEYTYKSCLDDECTDLYDSVSIDYAKDNNKTLMVLDYTLVLDDESSYMKGNRTYQSFFNDFLEIKYTLNNREYSFKADIINPSNYQDKLIMKVPREINDASDIKAVLTVRNRSYTVNL